MVVAVGAVQFACDDDSSEGPNPGFPVAATTQCQLSDTCPERLSDRTAIRANYRKDYYLSYEKYPEADIPDPVNGGRVQIAAVAQPQEK